MAKAGKVEWDRMYQQAGEADKALLNATAATKSGAWLEAPPNKNLDLRLTNAEITSRIGRRVGAEICEEGPCPFCFGVMDYTLFQH